MATTLYMKYVTPYTHACIAQTRVSNVPNGATLIENLQSRKQKQDTLRVIQILYSVYFRDISCSSRVHMKGRTHDKSILL